MQQMAARAQGKPGRHGGGPGVSSIPGGTIPLRNLTRLNELSLVQTRFEPIDKRIIVQFVLNNRHHHLFGGVVP